MEKEGERLGGRAGGRAGGRGGRERLNWMRGYRMDFGLVLLDWYYWIGMGRSLMWVYPVEKIVY